MTGSILAKFRQKQQNYRVDSFSVFILDSPFIEWYVVENRITIFSASSENIGRSLATESKKSIINRQFN